MDILSFLAQLKADGSLDKIAGNNGFQFGLGTRQYLGATLMPERLTTENAYTEGEIRATTIIANDASRYSPVQLKDAGLMVGTYDVKLGDQNIGSQFSARDYDALYQILGRGTGAMQDAANRVLDWANRRLNLPLIELNEKHIWEAIVYAQFTRKGDNGYAELITYPNPSGHRVTVGGTWSSDAYDPMDDLVAKVEFLADKGFTVSRMISSTRVQRIMQRNQQMALRNSPVKVLSAGDIVNRQTLADMNAGLQANGLPALETYDLTYKDAAGTYRFLPNDALVMLCTTGRDQTVELADGVRYLPDTLGYMAIGRTAGVPNPGRTLSVAYDDDPPHLEGKARQTSLPVPQEPEAIVVLSGIN